MVIIDEAMLRKRAEHNDKNLSNLEEVSLHQSNIEGISRCVGNLCPLLKILYLQNNLIPRLENLKRLKSLQYLNVAVNNIRFIEGLDRNENLNKLDFTVNFIDVDGLLTIARLKHNFLLRELYLTGNPCTQWEHCRAYVIAQLPQVTKLDGKNVMPSERIDAQQRLQEMHAELRALAAAKIQERSNEAGSSKVVAMPTDEEIIDGEVFTARALAAGEEESSDEETAEELQERAQQKVKWTPEQRLLSYQDDERRRLKKERKEQRQREARDPSIQQKRDADAARERALAEEERTGRVKNRNEGHWEFAFEDDLKGSIIATIFFPKFLDTSSIDIDVHPTWFRCTCKGKVIQLTLLEEVAADRAVAARNASNGALVLTLPRVGSGTQGPYPCIKASSSGCSGVSSSSSGASASKPSSRLTGSVDLHNMLAPSSSSAAAGRPKLLPLGVRGGNSSASSTFIIKEHQPIGGGGGGGGSSSSLLADDDDVPPLE